MLTYRDFWLFLFLFVLGCPSVDQGREGSLAANNKKASANAVDVIIPAYNEAESIGSVIKNIPANAVRDIIVVNNASTDTTSQNAHDAGAKVFFEPRRGYGYACMAWATSLFESKQATRLIDLQHREEWIGKSRQGNLSAMRPRLL